MRAFLGILTSFVVGCTASNGNDSSSDAGTAGGASGGQSSAGSGNLGGFRPSSGGSPSGGTSSGGASSGGSSSGGSSSGGSATGGGPTTVLPCTGLAGTSEWEHITPADPATTCTNDTDCENAGLDCTHCVSGHCDFGDSQAVVVHPSESGTLYVDMHRCGNGSSKSTDGLYKSTDCGATWTKMSTGANSQQVNSGSWCSFVIDPSNPKTIYTIDIYGAGGLWKSTNEGVDWQQMVPSNLDQYVHSMFFDGVSMDPNDPKHLVVGTHQGCAAPYDPSCELETTDAGATWKIAKLPWGWQETAGPWVLGPKTWLFGGGGLWLTTDDGSNWKEVSAPGAPYYQGGESENHPIPRNANGAYFMSSSAGIVKSTDEGRSWSLIPNSGGRSVGFAMAGGLMYTSDQWTASYHWAKETDDTKWIELPPPKDLAQDQGAPFLSFDPGHHVLYSSNFAGGLWRVVTP